MGNNDYAKNHVDTQNHEYTQNPFLTDEEDYLAALEAQEDKHMDSIEGGNVDDVDKKIGAVMSSPARQQNTMNDRGIANEIKNRNENLHETEGISPMLRTLREHWVQNYDVSRETYGAATREQCIDFAETHGLAIIAYRGGDGAKHPNASGFREKIGAWIVERGGLVESSYNDLRGLGAGWRYFCNLNHSPHIVVLDLDCKGAVQNGLESILAKNFELPLSAYVQTPSGGIHLYYDISHIGMAHDVKKAIKREVLQKKYGLKGVDLLGGSNGAGFAPTPAYTLHIREVSKAPGWISDALQEKQAVARALGGVGKNYVKGKNVTLSQDGALTYNGPTIKDGEGRHEGLVRAANALRDVSDDIGKIVDALKRYNATFPEPKTEREVLHIATSICKSREGQGVAKCDTQKVGYIYDRQLDRAVDFCLEQISSDRAVFNLQNNIVRVSCVDGEAKIFQYNEKNMTTELSKKIEFKALAKDKNGHVAERVIEPPIRVVRGVLNDIDKNGIKTLEHVVDHPVFLKDKTVASKSGYYEKNRLYLTQDFGLDETMSAVEALALLNDIVCDFPFKTPSHKSGWIAALLTPFLRYFYDGPSPLFLIDANTPSTGKTLLCDVTSLIITGKSMVATSLQNDDAEIRKNITRLLMDQRSIVWFENVESGGFFGGPVIDGLITSTQWDDRILGSNQTFKIAHKTTFYANGNNVGFRGDTSRRVVHVRLQSNLENPQEREGFKYDELEIYVKETRLKILSAIFTLIRVWASAKSKNTHTKKWGSFYGWSNTVRALLCYYDLPDPYDAVQEMQDSADDEKQTIRRIHALWDMLGEKYKEGATCQEVIKEVCSAPHLFEDGESLLRDLAWKHSAISSLKLGHYLKKIDGRIVDSKKIVGVVTRTKTKKWVLR